jgi:cytoskeletal protein RodZ
MELSIQERLKDIRVERGLRLGQLGEQTRLSKSALGSYETEDFKDIIHYALCANWRCTRIFPGLWPTLKSM